MSESSRPAAELLLWHRDARRRTLDLVAGLDDAELMGPRLAIVNPLRWEVGHVGWFQEYWTLRHARGTSPLYADGDRLYDSARVAHDTRWDLPLPSFEETLRRIEASLERALDRLAAHAPTEAEIYFHRLAVFHEDMHDEAFTYTRQTLGYAVPAIAGCESPAPDAGPLPGDVEVPGGELRLGAPRDLPFVFDNEKWAHPVAIEPFAIARAPVTNCELAAFAAEGGYRRREFWSAAGWTWRESVRAEHPVYWRPVGRDFERRHFDRWVPLEPDRPAIHVSWYEAQAYCNWAGRRLPTEAEWEAAAAGEPLPNGQGLAERKRLFPWGSAPPSRERANLEGRALGPIDVAALPAGDSAFGCRQMIGNVWEWTADDFLPYPGFVADPYEEYSEPWFGNHKVLRGGCWATRGRLIRNTWRNFYPPDRRDVFAGFRTCARRSARAR